MGLRLKILSGFLILAMMLLIAGVWSIYELRSIGTSVQKLLDDNYTSINAAKKMTEALEREDSALLLLLLGKWEQGRAIMGDADSLFQQGFQVALAKLTIPGEEAHLDAIKSSYQTFKDIWQKPIVDTQKEGDLDWYFEHVHRAFLDTKDAVDNLILLNEKIIYQTASDLHNRANRAVMPGIVAIIAALVFTLVFNYFVNFYVVGPIVKITDAVKKFIDHRLPFHVEIETKDEFSDLTSAIKTLSELIKTPEPEK
ncbi:MAG: MCP four helix bundle domain-containing protein [bacterium]